MKFFKRVALLTVVILGLVVSSHAMGQFLFFEHPLEGQTAPDFTLKTIGGEKINLSDYRGKQAAVIFFWATWCPGCRNQLKELNEKSAELQQKGLKILCVNLEEPAAQVRNYLERNHIKIEVLLDEKADIADMYSIVGIPTFFLIDSTGKIVSVENYLPDDYEMLLKAGSNGMVFSGSQSEPAGVDQ